MPMGSYPHAPTALTKGTQEERRDHVAMPISSLRDPASFAPPPRHYATGGSMAPPPPRPSQNRPAITAGPGYSTEEEAAEEAPSRPYRVDTTGLSTAHLPPPPGRGGGAGTRSPLPATGAKPPPPKLPPRLPPRSTPSPSTGSTSPALTPPPPRNPIAADKYLNQSSLSRLSAAGVSVSGLGIGSSSSPSQSSPSSPRPPPPPAAGTTFAQKQAAVQTASAFSRDPRSVSLSDARAAASTADSFRRRHGDQVAAGLRAADQASPGSSGAAGAAAAGFLAKKKPAPPPPPPKKKPEWAAGAAAQDGAPPPVPMGTKPRF